MKEGEKLSVKKSQILLIILSHLLVGVTGGVIGAYLNRNNTTALGADGKDVGQQLSAKPKASKSKSKSTSANKSKQNIENNTEGFDSLSTAEEGIIVDNLDEVIADTLSELSIAEDTTSIDVTDTVIEEQVPATAYQEREVVKVKTEQLLLSMKREILDLTLVRDSLSSKDSALSKMAGVYQPSSNFAIIEFWQSPLNFRGYKYANNKLVAYGLKPDNPEEFQLIRYQGISYLKAGTVVYEIKRSYDFIPYKKVQNPAVLQAIQHAEVF